jgi:hypothetical protein
LVDRVPAQLVTSVTSAMGAVFLRFPRFDVAKEAALVAV